MLMSYYCGIKWQYTCVCHNSVRPEDWVQYLVYSISTLHASTQPDVFASLKLSMRDVIAVLKECFSSRIFNNKICMFPFRNRVT